MTDAPGPRILSEYENQHMWDDPYCEVHGVLLNDYIELYSEKMGLISTEDGTAISDHTEPASYTLRVGSRYVYRGKKLELRNGERIDIPPNELVYVEIWERIALPYYMIARLNLRVTHVYHGLLLGTGPQVDPGFAGHLACPIHNLTAEIRTLKFKEKLATIDFTKTTPFAKVSIAREDDLLRQGARGRDGKNLKLWPKNHSRDRSPFDLIPGGRPVVSGLGDLTQKFSKLEKRVRFFRNLAYGTSILFALSVVLWATAIFTQVQGTVQDWMTPNLTLISATQQEIAKTQTIHASDIEFIKKQLEDLALKNK